MSLPVPTSDRLIVRPITRDETTESGLHLPESMRETDRAEVLAIGYNVSQFTVQPGETIYHSRYAGTTIEVDGKELLILREDDVLAVA